MIPSFHTLFRRSRYGGELGDGSEQSHKEQERFLAAAIAFCVKHDEHFGRTFANAVFGWKVQAPVKVTCVVEPYECADLLLACEQQAGALELKLGPNKSKLALHQDPESRRCKYLTLLQPHVRQYAVLGCTKNVGGYCRKNDVTWRKLRWTSVASAFQGPLLHDLRVLMIEMIEEGELPTHWKRVRRFPGWWKDLKKIALQSGLGEKNIRAERTEASGYRGYSVRRPKDGEHELKHPIFQMLAQFRSEKDWWRKDAAWFGYEINSDCPEISAGFFVQSARQAAGEIRGTLNLDPKKYAVTWEPQYVRITRPLEKQADGSLRKPKPNVAKDKEWMRALFKKIMDASPKHWTVKRHKAAA